MKDKLKVPKVRFKEFSGEWEEKTFDKFVTIKGGYAFDSNKMLNTPSKYQILKMSNVYKSKLLLDRSPSYIEEINEKEKDYILQYGDTIITLTGTVGKKDYGYSIIITENDKYLLNQRLAKISSIKDKSDNFFVNQYISINKFLDKFYVISRGGTGNQTNVSTKDMENIEVVFPTLPEQQKIADFLSKVDEKIEKLTKKKELLEQYKKGVMQKIFSQEIRFKDNNGNDFPEWEEKELGDCLDYIQPTNYIVKSTEYDNKYDIPVLTAGKSFGKSFILGYTNEEFGIFENPLPVIIFDDFTTSSHFVDFRFKVKSSAMKILTIKGDNNIKYIYEAMKDVKYIVGGHERHWISKYSFLTIQVPSLPEQQKIADFLSVLDKKIDIVNKELGQVQEFKKGLLQQMFV